MVLYVMGATGPSHLFAENTVSSQVVPKQLNYVATDLQQRKTMSTTIMNSLFVESLLHKSKYVKCKHTQGVLLIQSPLRYT